jgi:hypothetical protein
VRILFAALHNGYYRNLDSVVAELARRGHDIHLGAERPDSAFGGQPIVDTLAATYANVTHGRVAVRDPESLFLPARIRFARDYLRYLDPMYSRSSGLRLRAHERTPAGMLRLSRLRLFGLRPARRLVSHALDAIDRAVPPCQAIEQYLDEHRPDLVVITPLVGLVASSQLDLLRSALQRRIATAVVVWSWDHLSSKTIIRDVPDALLVWNEIQKQEAVHQHRFPAARIVVTGAQCYDRWFGRVPTRSRAEFCRHVGLPDDRPFVLWACSALLPGSPPEPTVVMRWASHLRASSDPRIRDVPILLRPHPSRTAEWTDVDWRSVGNIAMFGGAPVDEPARTDYFESLHYCAAVVGITTSAFLEAAVVGRPVMSFSSEDLRQEQEGSLHFRHLVDADHGLLTMAASLEEHGQQLASVLTGPLTDVLARQRRFVNAFVRPRGMEVSATEVVAATLERLGEGERVGPPSAPSLFGQIGLRLLARMQRDERWRQLIFDEREGERETRLAERDRVRAEELARKRADKARRMAAKRRGVRPDSRA